MLPGLRLRQVRERLGLTYRDVETASYELASRRGRPEFVLHISRLAEFENRHVVPGLHKLYSLAVLYHLNPLELFRWYEVPFEECFEDGLQFGVPHTHVAAPPNGLGCRCGLIQRLIRGGRIFCRAWWNVGATSRVRC